MILALSVYSIDGTENGEPQAVGTRSHVTATRASVTDSKGWLPTKYEGRVWARPKTRPPAHSYSVPLPRCPPKRLAATAPAVALLRACLVHDEAQSPLTLVCSLPRHKTGPSSSPPKQPRQTLRRAQSRAKTKGDSLQARPPVTASPPTWAFAPRPLPNRQSQTTHDMPYFRWS